MTAAIAAKHTRGHTFAPRGEQLKLNMPTGLRDRIKSHAAMNNRSMTGEIIAALEAAYPAPAAPDLLEALEYALEKLWDYGFSEGELAPIRAAIVKADPTAS